MSVSKKSWGGLQPVYVAPYRDFAVWPKDVIISPLYRHVVLTTLARAESTLDFEHLGWLRYECSALNCEVENVYLPKFRVGVLHPQTSQKHVSRVAGRLMASAEALGADNLICIDLTLDTYLSVDVSPYAIARLLEAVKEFQAELHKVITGHTGQLGGWVGIHTWRSIAPWEPKLHAHLVFPNVALGADKKFYRLRPLVDVRAVRNIWRKVCLKRGWIHDLQDVNLKARYIPMTDRRKCLGRLQYMFRLPRVDIAKCGVAPSELAPDDLTFLGKLMSYTTRCRAFGFCTRLKKLGVVVAILKNPPCPICGNELWNSHEKLKTLPNGIPTLQFDPGGHINRLK